MISLEQLTTFMETKTKQGRALMSDMETVAVEAEQRFEQLEALAKTQSEAWTAFAQELFIARDEFAKKHAAIHDRLEEFVKGELPNGTATS